MTGTNLLALRCLPHSHLCPLTSNLPDLSPRALGAVSRAGRWSAPAGSTGPGGGCPVLLGSVLGFYYSACSLVFYLSLTFFSGPFCFRVGSSEHTTVLDFSASSERACLPVRSASWTDERGAAGPLLLVSSRGPSPVSCFAKISGSVNSLSPAVSRLCWR